MTIRSGDLERDHAALEAEFAYEHRQRAERASNNMERDRLLEIAELHAEADLLRQRLGRIYDRLGELGA